MQSIIVRHKEHECHMSAPLVQISHVSKRLSCVNHLLDIGHVFVL